MQATTILSACDDGGIGMTCGVVLLEDVFYLSLHLVFIHTRFHRFQTTTERLSSNIACLLGDGDFILRFLHAQSIENRSSAAIVVHRVQFFDLLYEAFLNRFHSAFVFRVFVAVQEDGIAVSGKNDVVQGHPESVAAFNGLDT